MMEKLKIKWAEEIRDNTSVFLPLNSGDTCYIKSWQIVLSSYLWLCCKIYEQIHNSHSWQGERLLAQPRCREHFFFSKSDVQTHWVHPHHLHSKLCSKNSSWESSKNLCKCPFSGQRFCTAFLYNRTECCDTAEKLIVTFPFKRISQPAEELDSKLLQILPAGKKPGWGHPRLGTGQNRAVPSCQLGEEGPKEGQ